MSKDQDFQATIITKCTTKLKQELKDLSHHHKMNSSEMVRHLIIDAVNKYKDKP